MYEYDYLSDQEFDDLTIRYSALNSEIAAAKAHQKQAVFERLSAAICYAAAIIFVFCW